jgi:GcrA cell cycle regulator
MSNIGAGFWTDERVAELRTLWRDGYSMGKIAAEMQVPRSVIAGKLWRLGMFRGANGPTITLPYYHPTGARRKRTTMPPKIKAPVIVPTDAAARSFNDVSGPSYSVLDLDRESCRWPIGEVSDKNYCSCAAPRENDREPYCAAHNQVAFNYRA